MLFRLCLAGGSAAICAFAAWLATHVSSSPTILGRYSPGYFLLLVAVLALATASLLAHTPRVYKRLHAVRHETMLVAASAIASLAIGEVAVRWLDPLGISSLEEASRYHLDKVADPAMVFKHAPGIRRTYQGVEVATNELGVRDRHIERKVDGELRILALGDSVTFGWGVPFEETFAKKLEGKLKSRLGRPVRTVNSGVGGYNTTQEYAFLRAYFGTIDPDIVVLLYVSNDIERALPPFDPWSRRSLTGKSAPEALNLILGRSWLYRLGLFASQRFHTESGQGFDKDARGVRESMAALSGIAALCRVNGVTFVTFVYRPKGAPPGGRSDALLSEIARVGQLEQFPVVDVAPWWGNADMRSVTNSVFDSHPNARGHEILAAGMSATLVSRNLVPVPASQ